VCACSAHQPCHIVICILSGCTIIFHLINGTAFGGGGENYKTLNVFFVFFCWFFSENFPILKKINQNYFV